MPDFELYYNMLEDKPYCFGLSQVENLEVVGVNRLRRIPGFDYRGNGIFRILCRRDSARPRPL